MGGVNAGFWLDRCMFDVMWQESVSVGFGIGGGVVCIV